MTNLLYFKTVVEAEAEAMEVIVSNGSGREKKTIASASDYKIVKQDLQYFEVIVCKK